MEYCPQCGNQVLASAVYCSSCGTKFEPKKLDYQQGTTSKDNVAVPGDFVMPNTQRKIANGWIVTTMLFLIGIFVPSMIGMNGMDGGYGISVLAGFLAMSGLIVVLVYRARAKQMDRILAGEGRLALWHLPPEEWIRFIAADFAQEKEEKRGLFIIVGVITFIVGGLLIWVLQDPLVLVILAGIMVLVAVPAFWVPRLRHRKLSRSGSHVLISENGVIVGKMFHLWVQLGARLDHVALDTNERPKLLEFSYSMPTRTGLQQETARVPVPEGMLEEAVRIMDHLNRRCH